MKRKELYSKSRKKWLLKNIKTTENFIERFFGLMGKTHFDAEALLIFPCNSIHMFFMKMPIDAVFIDGEGIIIAVNKDMKPWSISPIYKRCHFVLELPAGSSDRLGLNCGEILSFIEYRGRD